MRRVSAGSAAAGQVPPAPASSSAQPTNRSAGPGGLRGGCQAGWAASHRDGAAVQGSAPGGRQGGCHGRAPTGNQRGCPGSARQARPCRRTPPRPACAPAQPSPRVAMAGRPHPRSPPRPMRRRLLPEAPLAAHPPPSGSASADGSAAAAAGDASHSSSALGVPLKFGAAQATAPRPGRRNPPPRAAQRPRPAAWPPTLCGGPRRRRVRDPTWRTATRSWPPSRRGQRLSPGAAGSGPLSADPCPRTRALNWPSPPHPPARRDAA